jgi:hypothetical protein
LRVSQNIITYRNDDATAKTINYPIMYHLFDPLVRIEDRIPGTECAKEHEFHDVNAASQPRIVQGGEVRLNAQAGLKDWWNVGSCAPTLTPS